MGFDDIGFFDEPAYRKKCTNLSYPELRKREIIKFRQHGTAGWAIGHGVGLAFFTCGVSLIGSVMGVRRAHVAHQKLKIVTAEVEKRGYTAYKPRKRDYTIPIVVCVCSLGLGIGTTIASFDVTSQPIAEGLANPDPIAVDEAVNQPTAFATDAVHGVEVQVEEVEAAVTGNGGPDMTSTVNESLAEQTAAGMDPSAFAMGQGLAQAAEVYAVQSAVEPLAYRFKGVNDKDTQVCTLSKPKYCGHKFARYCFGCSEEVTWKEHYHCCACHGQGFLFNVCEGCLVTMKFECRNAGKHVLYRIRGEDEEEEGKKGETVVRVESVGAMTVIA